jgi:GPH family glycoside/pentoside/hexuronide:cation symporter
MTSTLKQDVMPPLSQIFTYAFLALPLAFAGLPLYIHIPDFYTREMGLGLASAGIILMALRVADAVQDPLIGYISDKSATLQKIVIAIGVLALLSGMGALLAGPPSFVSVAYWFAGSAGLTALGLSMVNINLVMIGSLWSGNEAARGRASGMREALSLMGMLLASILPSILILSVSKVEVFQIFYIVFAVLLVAGVVAFYNFYKNLPGHTAPASKEGRAGVRIPVRFFIKNKSFIGACFLTHIAASFPAVLFLYFVTDYLGAGDKAGLFLFLYFVSGAGFMPVWLKLAGRYSAERAWFISMLLAIASFSWAFSLGAGDVIQFGIICIISGAALGADLAFPPVMLARRLNVQGGQAYATQAYAILNLIPKIALALGTGFAFLMLGKAGFLPSRLNSPDVLWTLASLYALVPCLVKVASAYLIFNLKNGATDDIQKRSSCYGHNDGA